MVTSVISQCCFLIKGAWTYSSVHVQAPATSCGNSDFGGEQHSVGNDMLCAKVGGSERRELVSN